MLKLNRPVLLLMVPAILGEAVQHAVEVHFGMYVLGDGISPGIEAQIRWVSAAIKVVGFLLTVVFARRAMQGNAPRYAPTPMAGMMLIAGPIIAHYALNYAAVGTPPAVTAMIVIVDCIVIGFLALAIGSVLPTRLSRRR